MKFPDSEIECFHPISKLRVFTRFPKSGGMPRFPKSGVLTRFRKRVFQRGSELESGRTAMRRAAPRCATAHRDAVCDSPDVGRFATRDVPHSCYGELVVPHSNSARFFHSEPGGWAGGCV